ncbi:MAG: hypothetical protein M4D80_14830 [Myxococcota bacterium]|nr:hypothetical protein [Myxococcota bacterium]
MTFSVGDVLATTVKIWVRNLPRFFLLTVICYLPILGWSWLYAAHHEVLDEHVFKPIARLHPELADVVSGKWVPLTVLSAAVAVCTVGRLGDERVTIWRALVIAMRRLPWLVGVAFIVRVATTGVMTVIAIVRWDDDAFATRASAAETIVYEVLLVALVSLFIVAVPVAAVERRGVLSSIARAFTLARGERVKVFAIMLVETVAIAGIFIGADLLLLQVSDTATEYGQNFLIYAYVRFAMRVILYSLAGVLAAVIYERLRASKEGPVPSMLQRVFA